MRRRRKFWAKWKRFSEEAEVVETNRYRIPILDSRGCLGFGIRDFLSLLGDLELLPYWRLLDLWVTMGESSMYDDERLKVETERPQGWNLTNVDLIAFAGHVNQTIDGIYVGYDFEPYKHRTRKWSELVEDAQVVIEAVDSSFWRFWARDAEVMRRIPARFEVVSLERIESDE